VTDPAIRYRHFGQDADRCPNRAFGSVLKGTRKAEISQHSVAHELGDETAIASDGTCGSVLVTPDHPSEELRIDFGRQRGRADHVGEQHRDLTPLGIAGTGLVGKFWLGNFSATLGDRLQQPAPVSQRQTEMLEIALTQFRQDIEIDVVRLERIGILFEFVPAQPIANIAHALRPWHPRPCLA
jgi:hypothetical protein